MGHASGGLAAAIVGEVPTGVSPELDGPKLPCATPGCRNKAFGSPRRRVAKVEEAAEEALESGEKPIDPPEVAEIEAKPAKTKAKSGARKKAKPNPALCRRCQNASALEALRQSEADDEARLQELHAGYSRR